MKHVGSRSRGNNRKMSSHDSRAQRTRHLGKMWRQKGGSLNGLGRGDGECGIATYRSKYIFGLQPVSGSSF